jgi:hypothetical protein
VSFLDYQILLFLGFCVKQFLGYLVVIFLGFCAVNNARLTRRFGAALVSTKRPSKHSPPGRVLLLFDIEKIDLYTL